MISFTVQLSEMAVGGLAFMAFLGYIVYKMMS